MEPQQTRIEPGVVVEASDGHGRLGTVDDVVVWPDTGEIAYLVGRRGWTDAQFLGPRKLIDSVPSLQEVRLRVRRDDVGEVAAAVPIEGCLAHQRGEELRIPVAEVDVGANSWCASKRGEELRIPVAEERLIPRQRWVDNGGATPPSSGRGARGAHHPERVDRLEVERPAPRSVRDQ